MHRALWLTGALCVALVVGYLLAALVAPRTTTAVRPTASASTPVPSGQQASPTVSPSPPTRRPPGAALAPGLRGLAKDATIVSLTFDDGSASQYTALDVMRPHRMAGTFYINTAMVGSSAYYMTWLQVADLAAAGNEIGGHTLHHVNMTGTEPDKERSEVCDDRQALVAARLGSLSFAYPEGGLDAHAEKVVRSCGYLNARLTGGLWYSGCGSCPAVETIPPADPYAIRTAPPVSTATTLADLQASVTTAEAHGGGWVPMVFHGICDDHCTAQNSLSPKVFKAFVDWLALRATKGTVVRTVAQVVTAAGSTR